LRPASSHTSILHSLFRQSEKYIMKFPKRIQPLIEDGLVDEVICQLMSGKEAMVYIVRCGTEMRCAKVYKEVNKRSFKKSGGVSGGP